MEEKVTHTKGPWMTRRDDAGVYRSVDSRGFVVLKACTVSPLLGSISPEEAKANTDLASAAPDLLAALEEIVEQYEHALPVEQAKAAIAKARRAK